MTVISKLFEDESRLKRLILCIFLALACSTIFSLIKYLHEEVPARNGLILPDSSPIGGDFIAFYVAGTIAKHSPEKLYDLSAQWDLQKKIFAEAPKIAFSPLPFVYPPLVAWNLEFLSNFEFVDAYFIWLLIQSASFVLAIWIVADALKLNLIGKLICVVIAFGYSAFSTLAMISSQLCFVGILLSALVFHDLKNKRLFRAGLFLSLSYYKPPLFLFFVVILFIQKQWRLISGFLLGAAILGICSWLMVGSDGMLSFFASAANYKYGSEVNKGIVFVPKFGAGLLAFLTTVFNTHFDIARIVFFILAGAILLYLAPIFRNAKIHDGQDFNLVFSLQLITSYFLSLHIVNYDMSLLIVPLIVVGAHIWQNPFNRPRVYLLIILLLVFLERILRDFQINGLAINLMIPAMFIWIVALSLYLRSNRLPKAISSHVG